MSLPTVRGMVMETEEETRRRHMARRRGFFSGLARAMTLRKDELESGEGRKDLGRRGERRERWVADEAKGRVRATRQKWPGRGGRRAARRETTAATFSIAVDRSSCRSLGA